MSTLFFPAGLSLKLTNLNLEEMEFYTRAWNLERIQMQKGLFTGSVLAAYTPRMQLMCAPYSLGILVQGDFPAGTILIGYVVTKADVIFQNTTLKQHEITILQSGDEIDFICNGESEVFTIAVEETFFYEAFYSYFGIEFSQYKNSNAICLYPEHSDAFIQGIKDWMAYLMQDHRGLKIDENYHAIESAILKHLFSSLQSEEVLPSQLKCPIVKVRDLLHQSIEESLDIGDLLQKTHISERTLHRVFKSNYGITPKRYLFNLRMSSIKQELLRANPVNDTITDIASKYSFFNLSTFSKAYKDMFGELPSTDLKREP